MTDRFRKLASAAAVPVIKLHKAGHSALDSEAAGRAVAQVRASRPRAGERDRTTDLPFTSWKRPSAKQQVGSLDSASELRKQAVEAYVWTSEGVHGGTILDHSWDQMGPALGSSSLFVR